MRRIKQPGQKMLFTGVVLGVAAAMWLLHIPCVFRAVLGVPCPGCGMTRAVLAALRLDLMTAFEYHPMFWAVPIGWLYVLFDGALFGRKRLDRAVLWAMAGGFLVCWAVKLLVYVEFC